VFGQRHRNPHIARGSGVGACISPVAPRLHCHRGRGSQNWPRNVGGRIRAAVGVAPPTLSAMLDKVTLGPSAIHTVKNEQGISGPRNDIGLFGPMTYSGQFCTTASIPPISSHLTDG
jgi:hypothetical protein